ncbi:MAG TPA: tetratricopeptide repeat protein, partial [bacterium]|nr:tetratricopeptide repeat protein [bacterium]
FFCLSVFLGTLGLIFARQYEQAKVDLSSLEKVLIAGRAFWFYIGKTLWPGNLMAVFPKWDISPTSPWQYLFPLGASVLLVTLWIASRRVGRGPAVAVSFFAITLAPTLGFISFPLFDYTQVALRYTYLASVGLSALLAVLASRCAERFRLSPRTKQSVAAGVLTLLGILTFQQARTYHDMETLFRHCLNKNPKALLAYINVGQTLQEQGKTNEAVSFYEKALAIDPNLPSAHYNYAICLEQLGKDDEAIGHYERALEHMPKSPSRADIHNNLGKILVRHGPAERAEEQFRAAIAVNPKHALAYSNLARFLVGQGKMDEARESALQAIRIAPQFPAAHYNLALTYSRSGRPELAIEHFRTALRFDPEFSQAALELAWILATSPNDTLRNGIVASEMAERVCSKSDGATATALDVLAAAYAETGQFAQAVRTAERALARAQAENKQHLVEPLRARIDLYRSNRPYRGK